MSKENKEPIENGKNRDNKGKFVKGNTASVGKGRPKGSVSIPDILRRVLKEEVGNEQKISRLEAILLKVIAKAYDGDMPSINFVADRLEGKPKQIVGLQDITDEPIKVFDFDNELED